MRDRTNEVLKVVVISLLLLASVTLVFVGVITCEITDRADRGHVYTAIAGALNFVTFFLIYIFDKKGAKSHLNKEK